MILKSARQLFTFQRKCTHNNLRKFSSGNVYEQGKLESDALGHRLKDDNGQKFEVFPSKKRITRVGQPTSYSHPHLLKEQELTIGITAEEYNKRRFNLMDLVQRQQVHSKHHIIVVVGNPRRYKIDKIPYAFRQDTDMLYMTGCLEPDCLLVLHTLPTSSGYRSLIFTPPHSPGNEVWDGPRTAAVDADAVWGVDQGLPLTELRRYLESIEKELDQPTIWCQSAALAYHTDEPLSSWLTAWTSLPRTFPPNSLKSLLHSMRLRKSPAEIDVMRTACDVSARAVAATIRACPSPASERALSAAVEFECRVRGADGMAYPSVVAGGDRANVIHNIRNDAIVQPGQMVLMDAGAEYAGFCGDVTRTWPVDGTFRGAQRDIYEAVLAVQGRVLEELVRRPSLDRLFAIMCAELGLALQELCLIPKDVTGGQLSRAAYSFCPHHVSHYLGMDVHDTPLVPKSNPVLPGCVFAVEPGIYVNENNKTVDARYRGIGIRIEDDVLLTEAGWEVLSKACPKHPDEVQRIVGADLQ